jgi:protocatechuate 3,4-dioxygenase, beta subunit
MKAAGLGILLLLNFIFSCQSQTDSGKIVIAGKDEPGARLRVEGIVKDKSGKGIPGVIVYTYQTDQKGLYNTENSSGDPRLKGTVKTNSEGKFELETIKPGSYPNSRNPSHIHFEVYAKGYKKRYTEIVFEGDSFISDQMRKDAENPMNGISIVNISKDKSKLSFCTTEIILEKE